MTSVRKFRMTLEDGTSFDYMAYHFQDAINRMQKDPQHNWQVHHKLVKIEVVNEKIEEVTKHSQVVK